MSAARILRVAGAGAAEAAEAFRAAATVILRGGIVAHPTETVYGLAVDPWNRAAVERLESIKGRERKSGIIVIVASVEEARRLITDHPPASFEALVRAFWPGAVTLVLTSAAEAPAAVLGSTGGIAVRCTSDPVARGLIVATGRALTSTSANLAGRPPAGTADEAAVLFGDRIDLVIDGGERRSPVASTMVDLTGREPTVLREGAVPREQIEAALRTRG